jgi:hypothetical protein
MTIINRQTISDILGDLKTQVKIYTLDERHYEIEHLPGHRDLIVSSMNENGFKVNQTPTGSLVRTY